MRCKDKTLPPTKHAGSEEGIADSPTLEARTPPQIDIKEPALGDAVVSRGRALGGERQGSP